MIKLNFCFGSLRHTVLDADWSVEDFQLICFLFGQFGKFKCLSGQKGIEVSFSSFKKKIEIRIHLIRADVAFDFQKKIKSFFVISLKNKFKFVLM